MLSSKIFAVLLLIAGVALGATSNAHYPDNMVDVWGRIIFAGLMIALGIGLWFEKKIIG